MHSGKRAAFSLRSIDSGNKLHFCNFLQLGETIESENLEGLKAGGPIKPAIRISLLSIWVVVFSFSSAVPVHAKDGKLKLHVTPKQAYVFVDGHAISEASRAHEAERR
jgi:hypothetical protein